MGLFSRKTTDKATTKDGMHVAQRKGNVPGSPIRLSCYETFGDHIHRVSGEDCSVLFWNDPMNISKIIIDNAGNILDFPGVEEGDWTKYLHKTKLDPVVRFRSTLDQLDNDTFRFYWQVQPNGLYWGKDDAYGMENDVQIILYADINKRGNFKKPFRIYKLDGKLADGIEEAK